MMVGLFWLMLCHFVIGISVSLLLADSTNYLNTPEKRIYGILLGMFWLPFGIVFLLYKFIKEGVD